MSPGDGGDNLRVALHRLAQGADQRLVERHAGAADVVRGRLGVRGEQVGAGQLGAGDDKAGLQPTAHEEADALVEAAHRTHQAPREPPRLVGVADVRRPHGKTHC